MKTDRNISRSPMPAVILYGSALLTIVVVWEALTLLFFPRSPTFPGAFQVLYTLFMEMSWRELLYDSAISMSRVAVGASTAIFTGVLLGLACSVLPRIGKFFTAILEYFRPIPPIAWIPLAILWFGIGELPSYFIIFLASFFPVFTNSLAGGQSVTQVHRDVARSVLLSRRQYVRHILVPMALPQIMTGIQIGLGFSWMAVIASEMVAAQRGLGHLIQLNRLLLMSDRVIAGMLLIGIIGFTMNHASVWVGRFLTPWAKDHGNHKWI